MKASDFNLSGINKALRNATATQEIDFGQIISMPFDIHLSVVAKQDRAPKYITLNEALEPIETLNPNAYFGASPVLDNKMIIDAISDLKLQNEEMLDCFIRENASLFSVTEQFQQYLLPLARYIVIAFASNFHMTFYVGGAEKGEFSSFAEDNPYSVTCKEVDDDEDREIQDMLKITIVGCPTDTMLEFLSCFRYTSRDIAGEFLVSSKGIDIVGLYKKRGNLVLKNNDVFYSGALLKSTRIEIMDNVYENYKSDALCIYYLPSTYATVHALDHNFVYHPLLERDRSHLISMLRSDDESKMSMIEALCSMKSNSPEEILGEVNKYLFNSVNVNQVGVSANITTSDNVLLIGKRSAKSIDRCSLYPSVNGNAELADSKVSFYQYSTHEDVPTMNPNDVRNDFFGEIVRETSSELRLFYDANEFSCIGFTICGNIPLKEEKSVDNYTASYRRCHFNILYDVKAKESYEEVERLGIEANEAFENEKLKGISVKCYKNIFSYVSNMVLNVFDFISDYKDMIESLLIILLTFASLVTVQSIEENPVSFVISLILAAMVSVSAAHKIFLIVKHAIHRSKHCRRITIFKSNSYATLQKRVAKSFRGYKYHPVTYAAVELYVEKMVYDDFFSEGRRSKRAKDKKKSRKR